MREWRQADTANGELETKTNTVTNEEWLFQYDALGNLVSVGLPNGDLVEYLVDGLGRRVGKKKNGVLLKQWIYRNALKPVAELDGSGNLVAQFAYGSKRNVPDYVLRGGATYRVVSDHLGSPRYAVNVANSSDVPFTASYTSFGEVTGTGIEWMPFGFAGGVYDTDTGLVRFGARDYDWTVGRWTVKDPISFDGGDLNLYRYVGGSPVNHIDPPGTGPIACIAALAACGAFTIWEYYSLSEDIEECQRRAEEAKREHDRCDRNNPEDIQRMRRINNRVEADCLYETISDLPIMAGIGAGCAAAIAICVAPTF